MAGDWLKIEKDTPEKPEILIIAVKLGISWGETFYLCFKLWRWADSHCTDGTVDVDFDVIDAVVGFSGFSQALLDVGWLLPRSGSVQLPNFARHMGQAAKSRLLAAERKREQRKCHKSVPEKAGQICDNVPNPLLFSLSNTPDVSLEVDHTKIHRSIRPTVVEVSAYCVERANSVDPQAFFDFYESKGWKVGNQTMKDWQAAVRTWERRPQHTPSISAGRPKREIPQLL